MRKLLGDERTSLAMLVLMFGLAAVNWPLLPDELPIHWSSADEPDSYAPRAFALLFLPVLAVVQYWILRIVARRVAPVQLGLHADGDAEDDEHWYWACATTLVTAAMLAIYIDTLIAFRGFRVHPGALVGLVLMAFAPLLPHIDRNPVIGVRTPWTLKSDHAWKRTHRMAARSTYVIGPLLIAGDMLGVGLVPGIVGGVLAWALALTVYSYVQWRNDPDRP